MPESVGVIGLGTLLKIGNGQSPETFTTILEVLDLTGPSRTLETVDFTHQQSLSSYREYRPTLKLAGEMTFKCHYANTDGTQDQFGSTNASLTSDFENRTLRNFQIYFPIPTPKTFYFHGFVTKLQPSAPLSGAMVLDVTIKITGPVTES
jgi:hypothetical protein